MKRFNPQILFLVFFCLLILFAAFFLFGRSVPSIQSLASIKVKPDIQNGVFVFLSSDCPICKKYQGSLNFKPFKGHTVYYVFPGQQNSNEIVQFAKYDKLNDEIVLLDKDFKLTQLLNAEVTPEVILRNNGKTVYKGKIDNRFKSISSYITQADTNYLENALISLEKNGGKDIVNTQAVGCFIEPY